MWPTVAPRRTCATTTWQARAVLARAETGQEPPARPKKARKPKRRSASSIEGLAALEGLSSESLADIESLSVEELKKQRAKEEARLRKLRDMRETERLGGTEPSMADWKKGSFLPEGFAQLSTQEKLKELWMGKYGALYWSTRLSYVFVGITVVGYILFRFVGPLLGLYELYD